MSSSNVMRLWKDAIVINGENIDLSARPTAMTIAFPTGTTITGTSGSLTISSATSANATLNNSTIATDVTHGLTIGTSAAQKLGFFGATPVVQQLASTSLETALSNLGLRAAGSAAPLAIGALTLTSIVDGAVVALGGTTGAQIGTSAGQKLGLWGATPVAQQGTTGTTAGFTAGSGTTANSASTFTGGTGSAAYTVGDVVLALKKFGLLAS